MNNETRNMGMSEVELVLRFCATHSLGERPISKRHEQSPERSLPLCRIPKALLPLVLIKCFPCNLLITIQFPWYRDARKRVELDQVIPVTRKGEIVCSPC